MWAPAQEVVVNELEFPAGYAMELDPENGYVAVVLEGACEKTFVRGSRSLVAGSATIYSGAALTALALKK